MIQEISMLTIGGLITLTNVCMNKYFVQSAIYNNNLDLSGTQISKLSFLKHLYNLFNNEQLTKLNDRLSTSLLHDLNLA
jgi:hypothetical protein